MFVESQLDRDASIGDASVDGDAEGGTDAGTDAEAGRGTSDALEARVAATISWPADADGATDFEVTVCKRASQWLYEQSCMDATATLFDAERFTVRGELARYDGSGSPPPGGMPFRIRIATTRVSAEVTTTRTFVPGYTSEGCY
jgi:hypothetical protein